MNRVEFLPKPKGALKVRIRKIAPVLRRVMMNDGNDEQHDLGYSLGRPVKGRAAVVTYIISQSLTMGQRMDKTKLLKKKLSV